mmetsp:Transcript_158228/g.288449  ORF Transcript_158228/g.288449 Transcript_158228/m.288449 type:complete len:210 (+) Transcript_158228:433-1062(+)
MFYNVRGVDSASRFSHDTGRSWPQVWCGLFGLGFYFILHHMLYARPHSIHSAAHPDSHQGHAATSFHDVDFHAWQRVISRLVFALCVLHSRSLCCAWQGNAFCNTPYFHVGLYGGNKRMRLCLQWRFRKMVLRERWRFPRQAQLEGSLRHILRLHLLRLLHCCCHASLGSCREVEAERRSARKQFCDLYDFLHSGMCCQHDWRHNRVVQ